MSDALFLFAHQDDEVGACPSILRELRSSRRVWCAYLTDGAFTSDAAVRDAESLRFLGRLGVDAARIGFVADARGRCPDGALVDHLERADRGLAAWLSGTGARFARVYAPDWEGGHTDHDAVHLVALSTAARLGCPLYVFSLYNAYRRPPRLFRVIDLIPNGQSIETHPISWRDCLTTMMAPLAFPSQRRTWVALGAGLIVRMLWRRTERIRRALPARVAAAPHPGPLLYETLFGHSYDAFMVRSRAYRSHLLGHAECSSPR